MWKRMAMAIPAVRRHVEAFRSAVLDRDAAIRERDELARRFAATQAFLALNEGDLSHPGALRRIAARGVPVATIIDVGASDGRWSIAARDVFPGVPCLLVEAKADWLPDLEDAVRRFPGFGVANAVAGPVDGEAEFFMGLHQFGGRAVTTGGAGGGATRRLPQISLDAEVARRGLRGPYLLKLDTHGYETEILAGAGTVIAGASLIVIEMYNYIEPRFPEMVRLVESMGFQCVDIAEPMWRDHDKAIWQVDFFFVRKDRPEAVYKDYY